MVHMGRDEHSPTARPCLIHHRRTLALCESCGSVQRQECRGGEGGGAHRVEGHVDHGALGQEVAAHAHGAPRVARRPRGRHRPHPHGLLHPPRQSQCNCNALGKGFFETSAARHSMS